MIVRAIDSNGDWQFGKGSNDYRRAQAAIAQNLKTRLNSFLGDCFFDLGAGINWLGFLGGKDELGLNLAIASVILNTDNIVSMIRLSVNLNGAREFSVSYNVTTTYGILQSESSVTL